MRHTSDVTKIIPYLLGTQLFPFMRKILFYQKVWKETQFPVGLCQGLFPPKQTSGGRPTPSAWPFNTFTQPLDIDVPSHHPSAVPSGLSSSCWGRPSVKGSGFLCFSKTLDKWYMSDWCWYPHAVKGSAPFLLLCRFFSQWGDLYGIKEKGRNYHGLGKEDLCAKRLTGTQSSGAWVQLARSDR